MSYSSICEDTTSFNYFERNERDFKGRTNNSNYNKYLYINKFVLLFI